MLFSPCCALPTEWPPGAWPPSVGSAGAAGAAAATAEGASFATDASLSQAPLGFAAKDLAAKESSVCSAVPQPAVVERLALSPTTCSGSSELCIEELPILTMLLCSSAKRTGDPNFSSCDNGAGKRIENSRACIWIHASMFPAKIRSAAASRAARWPAFLGSMLMWEASACTPTMYFLSLTVSVVIWSKFWKRLPFLRIFGTTPMNSLPLAVASRRRARRLGLTRIPLFRNRQFWPMISALV
mmetsp:Transcript_140969/g.351513  ORF Transcript_140969/g.351513 Transcript_140969/m.351513 type:complete len:242 (-) Transcript_140969:231-956(-)